MMMNTFFKFSVFASSVVFMPQMAWSETMNHHDHAAMADMAIDHRQHQPTTNKPNVQNKAKHSKPTSNQQIQSKQAQSTRTDHSKHTHEPSRPIDNKSVDHSQYEAKPSAQHDHASVSDMPMDHSQHTATSSQSTGNNVTAIPNIPVVDHSDHQSMTMPLHSTTRSPDYSNGQQSHASHHMNDNPNFWSIDAEKLELARQNNQDDDQYSGQYDVKLWYGNSENRLYLNNSGEFEHKNLQSASSEIAWWHAIAPYWNSSLGFKQEYGHSQRDQSWLSAGINGIAPYWFDLGANFYLSKDGDIQLKLNASYDLYISPKLVFQPDIATTFYGKNNPKYQYGAGLASIESGFKLRYDITPQLSPYIGFEHQRSFGKTAGYLRQQGDATHNSQIAIGLRFWY
jgi:copper resistance protein B